MIGKSMNSTCVSKICGRLPLTKNSQREPGRQPIILFGFSAECRSMTAYEQTGISSNIRIHAMNAVITAGIHL
jgi:hypothetical protein